jgi:hypothetical protein
MRAERVGVYGFDGPPDAALAYFDRMSRAGVTIPSAVDCPLGDSADHAWGPGDGAEPPFGDGPIVEYRGRWWSANRLGCFLDDDGTANFRVTCGDGLYIGIVGRDHDLASLYQWTVQYPPGLLPELPQGDVYTPGICASSHRSSP